MLWYSIVCSGIVLVIASMGLAAGDSDVLLFAIAVGVATLVIEGS